MTTARPWRQEIELLQNFAKHATFTLTTSGATAEDVVLITGNMEEANRVSLVVELGDAYIEFDDDASTSSMYIPQDEGYFDDGIWIGSKISIIRGTSTNVRIRGIIWGR
jgi:hypothetical protein|tara:strand:+ start:3337 stop:3663 length:327 start_codon:yes stop_codon:yes gene_type:complete